MKTRPVRLHDLPDFGFRAPTDPRLILPERRPPLVANAGGGILGRRHGVRLEDLTRVQRAKFDAQMEAWRAGCALQVATDAARMEGHSLDHQVIQRWEAARGGWERWRHA